MNSLVDDARIRSILDRLHDLSDTQEPSIEAYFAGGRPRPTGFEAEGSPSRAFWEDKYVALDRDKAELVYALARAGGARRVVEAGTSFGVSTIYLAAAVRDNGGGLVTTCEIETRKADVARRHFEEAGVEGLVDLRVGDIRETLDGLEAPIDLLLLDIWAPIAGAVLALVGPHVRVGGVVVADNTVARHDLYAALFAYLGDPANGFTTRTLPFDGGLELAVKTGSGRRAR